MRYNTTKYGIKVFANGHEIVSRVYTSKKEAIEVANKLEETNKVYRFLINGKTAKKVESF